MSEYKDGYDPEDVMQANLLRMIYEAKNGDTIAAQNSISLLYGVLASTTEHKLTGESLTEPMPIPDWVRHYLADVLLRIMNGEDANKAFYLKKSGGRKTAWSYYAKLAVAETVFYFHKHPSQQKSIEQSCATVAEGINAVVKNTPHQLLGAWRLGHFIGRQELTQELVQKWYYEVVKTSDLKNGRGGEMARLFKTYLRNTQ